MSKSVEAASASSGLSFVDAFREAAKTGRSMRRSCWSEGATLVVGSHPGDCLVRHPEHRNWSGEFSPCLEEVEATDWEVV